MILYHGSNVDFDVIDLNKSKTNKDFGKGFYLSDNYGYCVSSFKIIDLDSGAWHGNDAWVLYDDGKNLYILVGGYRLEEALEVKGLSDNDFDTSEYNDYLVWTDAEEWVEQQEFA